MTAPRTAAMLAAGLIAVAAAAALPAAASLPEGSAQLSSGALSTGALSAQPALLRGGATPPPDSGAARRLGQRVLAALGGSSADTVAAAVDVDQLGTVLRQDADHALPPASTRKLFTAAAALLALAPDTRMVTEVAATSRPRQGLIPANLWLVAGGDPYLTSTQLRGLAHAVRAAGITRVGGNLLLDDGRYDGQRRVSGWKQEYVPTESGPLSALAVDANQWRHDASFLADPALPAAVQFRQMLADEGVTVHGTVRRGARPSSAYSVATQRSGPLSAIVRRLTKASDNFAAELLLKEVGRAAVQDGSSRGGVRGVRAALQSLGVTPGTASDGSGLSADDRQSAAGELALLKAVDASASGPAFRGALPVACHDGTLVHRFCGTPAQDHLVAKTGTLDFVTALSGYTRTAAGRTAWFSFILTGVHDQSAARQAIDRAALEIVNATE